MKGKGVPFLRNCTSVPTLLPLHLYRGHTEREDRERPCPDKRPLKTWSQECGSWETYCAYLYVLSKNFFFPET